MGLALHQKIVRLLGAKGLASKDLATALGVTGQALGELLKGRGTLTLVQLKALVRFFGISADYWLDDSQTDPTPADFRPSSPQHGRQELQRQGIVLPADRAAFQGKLRTFALEHPAEWAAQFGALSREELNLLRPPAAKEDPEPQPETDPAREPRSADPGP